MDRSGLRIMPLQSSDWNHHTRELWRPLTVIPFLTEIDSRAGRRHCVQRADTGLGAGAGGCGQNVDMAPPSSVLADDAMKILNMDRWARQRPQGFS